MPYSEALAYIKKTDHRKSKWCKLAVSLIKPGRAYSVAALNAQRAAAEAAEEVQEELTDAE